MESRPERTLIAGCGYVGMELARRLVADGHEVWGLRRDPSKLPDGVNRLRADLTRPETLTALPANLDAVVFAAAPGRGGEQSYREIYLDGMEVLLRGLADQAERPGRVVFLSSTSVYGQRRGEWIDEDSPTFPIRQSGEVMVAAERVLSGAPLASTIIRLGGIYGPGRPTLIDRVRSGTAVRQRGAPHYTNRIHLDDVVGFVSHVLAMSDPESLYLGVDTQPSDEAEIFEWIASQLGRSAPRLQEADEELPPRRAGSKRCRSTRLLASGYQHRYPTYREGYAPLFA